MASKYKKGDKGDPFAINVETPYDKKLEETSYKLEWTENSLIDGEDDRDNMRYSFDFSYIKRISIFLAVFLLLLLGRVAWLQIVKDDHYSAMAKGNRIREKSIEASRGIIYDRDGRTLVRNTANFMLYLVPGDLPPKGKERSKIFEKIFNVLSPQNSSQQVVLEKVRKKIKKVEDDPIKAYQPLFLADNIEYEKAISLYLQSRDMPGVVLSDNNRRVYLNEIPQEKVIASSTDEKQDRKLDFSEGRFQVRSLSHILGYTGKINKKELNENDNYSPIDYIGKTGLEKTWEEQLRGEKGEKRVEVDAIGREKRIISKEKPEEGNNLVLSVDFPLQAQVEAIVKRHLADKDIKKASVIVMDPQNGEILSLVSTPAYNNNVFVQGVSSQQYQDITGKKENSLFNRAISGEYPSGSTIKPVIAAAALEEGIISANTTVNSTGGIRIGEWFFPDWREGGHGVTDVRKAIAQSVNTFFYYIGGGYKDFSGLGMERIIEYDKKFGLGSKTGIDLPSEASGFLPTKEWKKETMDQPWYIGDTYHLSIGQGFLLVTPLQVANFTSVFANKGTLHQPHLVKKVVDGSDESVQRVEPKVLNSDFIGDYVVQVVREGMRRTVTSGSGRSLSTLEVDAAGKTGTAQWSSEKPPHAWFTCFAPYDDPEIVVTVLVEKGGEGHDTAVPISKEILEYYFDKKE